MFGSGSLASKAHGKGVRELGGAAALAVTIAATGRRATHVAYYGG